MQYESAPDIANQIIQSIPEDTPEYTKTLIKIKRALGDNDGAMETAIAALEDKSDHRVMFAALRLAWDLGSMEEAVSFSEKIISSSVKGFAPILVVGLNALNKPFNRA